MVSQKDLVKLKLKKNDSKVIGFEVPTLIRFNSVSNFILVFLFNLTI